MGKKKDKSAHESDDFKKLSRNLYIIVGLEILCTVVLSCILFFGLIEEEYYTPYVDSVVEDWKKGPIVELRFIKKDETCDKDTMVKYMKAEAAYNSDGGKNEDATFGWDSGSFEVLGAAYWWNMRQGCYCPSGSSFGPTPG